MTNKYGYVEFRRINSENLRNLCIKNKWYTKGNNEEYFNFFKMADKDNLSTDDIVELATDILEHSEIQDEQNFCSICFEIANECYTFFEEF